MFCCFKKDILLCLNFLYITLLPFLILIFILRIYVSVRKVARRSNFRKIGFFHPYCNAGGGGERVLWAAIRAVQKEYSDFHCIVYSGDTASTKEILDTARSRFDIQLHSQIEIVRLKCRFLVEAKYYPFCTLFMQSLGSFILGLEALLRYPPDIFIDTMGYAWTLPLFRWIGSAKTGAYVHFPTISTDMLSVVQERRISVNNKQLISRSKVLTSAKLFYYRCFAFLYKLAGRQAQVVMVNSSWTRNHIDELWNIPGRTFTIFPPCNVSQFKNIPLEAHKNKNRILSIAQFRPEKNHELQIDSFNNFLKNSQKSKSWTLVLVGSCRHEEDYAKVASLKSLCQELGISEKVEFRINLSFPEIIKEMENASVGLHTMRDEHFGIGIVECMSAGLIMIAHDSGGPKLDILVDFKGKRTGFLASDESSFAKAMEEISEMTFDELDNIRQNARESVTRFSDQYFEEKFLNALELVM